ncbi:hypothetical protein [Agromyces sp. NBRC 114283]|uniref:hypothetical protein n=1 Tax=Agromyces sp. NBRC 114283 TaxID=2994521 RepID=UPI0024A5BF86|nr:hypothetical protein [Agromyces sp. NBRC 114283]GLU91358.1 hypothetical protein Agsp01_36130 [Agromyces sp. NBRC 114283]
MAARPGFPAVSGAATFDDIRRAMAGDFARNAAGALRPGILPHTDAPLITGKASMAVDVAMVNLLIDRSGAVRLSNDGTVSVTISAAPASGSRWSVIYARQREATKGDGADGPIIDKVEQTSLSAARALLPAGALELGHVQVPAGSGTTNAAGVIITQTALYTASSGGVVWLRNQTEESGWTPADGSLAYRLDTKALLIRRGGAWARVNDGLNLITTVQIAAGSTELVLDNIFSDPFFDNYLVQLDIEATASRNLQAQLRAGGATKTSSYWTQVFYGGGGSAAAAAQANVAQWQLTGVAGQIHGIDLKVRRPFDAAWRTMALTEGTATDLGGPSLGKNENGHWYGTSEAHDGLRISLVAPSGATFKGTAAVYGYYKG